MSIEHAPPRQHRLNWRVSEFCGAFGMGRTKFYGLVSEGKIKVVKCGRSTLVTDAERQRFQQAIEAGEI